MILRRLSAVGVLSVLTACLYAQGINTTATKSDWEEINFEFNSSILSDGYPSLLRLADLLGQHSAYRVKVTGNTDYVGTEGYNTKLALARAGAVREFLIKYGASASQITTGGSGERNPEVKNDTKEGRFMNRRVVLTVTDGQGKVVGEGGVGDVIKSLGDAGELKKGQEECCSKILKRLDKLDEILAAVRDLKGENDKLKGEVADLRNQQNALKSQIAGLPKPLSAQETTSIARDVATKAGQDTLEEALRRNKKFSLLGLNIGPTFGSGRTGDFTLSGRGQFFSPFGGSGTHAVQAQGEYMYYPDRQEGQFDLGLVNRWSNVQAGIFSSFKYLNLKQYQNGGGLMQGAFLVDYLFSRGKIGIFGTKGFKNEAILGQTNLGPSSYLQTYARIVDQVGGSAQVGLHGNSYLEGNLAYLRLRSRSDRPGGMIRFVQPLSSMFAFTAELGYNETLVNGSDSGRVVFGLQMGNFIHPKEYRTVTSPVPMDVPRVRYELLTRRVGNSPPVADAGPDQIGVPAGSITLNGTGSYDPDGDALTYRWTQISGVAVSISGSNAATATFTAATGQSYSFRLTVTDPSGLQSTARTTVTTTSALAVRILQFTATPNTIRPGERVRLAWLVENADTVTISPAPGSVDSKTGTSDVTPAQTTTYTLTARGASGTVTSTAVVTVQAVAPTDPRIIRFEAMPVTILLGETTNLSWTTDGVTDVSISGIGAVDPNGSRTVSPAQTTTYTLTAKGSDGRQVTASVTVTVTTGQVPQVIQFVASPASIDSGSQSKLCWQVSNSTSIDITGVGSGLKATDCATVSPTSTTSYILTARNGAGQVQAYATVTVTGTLRILSFTSDPVTSTSSGNPVTLMWTTQGATSVVITGNYLPGGTLAVNGSVVVNPTTNSTYTLIAYGPGGQQISAVISVFVR
jgi:hypothetical protein